MVQTTDDLRILEITPLSAPARVIADVPCSPTSAETVAASRTAVHKILSGDDDRLVVVVGPCSIHDPVAALDYARRLNAERQRHAGDLEIIMRVYFEKPRTTVGWKGLINDPHLDGSFEIEEGLRIARRLLVDINDLGLPAGCELLDTITPQYIADLVSWGAIGARTTESQVHREL
ncbi:MAG: 3-deoxy-7-phosphoheptulonate synthase, partial [Rhizobium sp.]